jgi:hypothetical protein
VDSTTHARSTRLTAATSGFVLSAAIAVLVNTALSCAKDAYPPLKALLASMTDHDWTTQGLIDLVLFVGAGIVFTKTRLAGKMDPGRLIGTLIGAVVIASVGLALWFGFV